MQRKVSALLSTADFAALQLDPFLQILSVLEQVPAPNALPSEMLFPPDLATTVVRRDRRLIQFELIAQLAGIDQKAKQGFLPARAQAAAGGLPSLALSRTIRLLVLPLLILGLSCAGLTCHFGGGDVGAHATQRKFWGTRSVFPISFCSLLPLDDADITTATTNKQQTSRSSKTS